MAEPQKKISEEREEDVQDFAFLGREFMTWLRREVAPGDTLLAEDGVDFAWALRHQPGEPRRIASFSPAPYMHPLTREDFVRFAGRTLAPEAPPLFVIVRGEEVDDAAWRRRYGDVIAEAVAGRRRDGDELVLERVLEGKRILRWRSAVAPQAGVGQPH